MADGSYLGLLSGGCLEADLKLHAQEVLDGGATRAVEYDMRGPDDALFGIGAGCEGAMRVLLEPANAADPAAVALAAAARITAAGDSTCLVCVHESGDLALGTYSAERGASPMPYALTAAADAARADQSSREVVIGRGPERLRAFVQFLAPPPHLLLCGAGPDAQPVAAAARALGWRVSVVDHRPAYAQPQQISGGAGRARRSRRAPRHGRSRPMSRRRGDEPPPSLRHRLPSCARCRRGSRVCGSPRTVGAPPAHHGRTRAGGRSLELTIARPRRS